MEVEPETEEIIKQLIAIAEFKKELKCCVKIPKRDPLRAKRIWKA